MIVMSMLHLQQNKPESCSWQHYEQDLLHSALFRGLKADALPSLLQTMQARLKKLNKKAHIFQMGDRVDRLGILLRGVIEISRHDILGNSFIIARLDAPSLFAEVLACAGIRTSPVNISVLEPSVILTLDFNKLLDEEADHLSGRSTLILNMTEILARKNLMLNSKLDVMSKRSTRAKVATVLLNAAADQGTIHLYLPYNRQQLADYLAVDRSALSRELSSMQKEGLITYQRHNFQLLKPDQLAQLL